MKKTLLVSLLVLMCSNAQADELRDLKKSLLFHATFNRSADADHAKGDAKIYTAESLERKSVQAGLQGDAVKWQADGGREGGALHFVKATQGLTFFKGNRNVPFEKVNFAGTVSLWMRVSPTEDLPQGYVDPLQITDKKWNDASFFVDFDQAESREFRLGAFADFKSWNPNNRKFDDIPVKERPMVVVKKSPFARNKWTHVVFTWSRLNADENGSVTLYIDGKKQGNIAGKQTFTWKPDDVVIMLGINYVGWIDDLAIYSRALTAKEVKLLK